MNRNKKIRYFKHMTGDFGDTSIEYVKLYPNGKMFWAEANGKEELIKGFHAANYYIKEGLWVEVASPKSLMVPHSWGIKRGDMYLTSDLDEPNNWSRNINKAFLYKTRESARYARQSNERVIKIRTTREEVS